MPRPLEEIEFSILQTHVSAGDRIAYYSQLEDWGYSYGGLALGVVNNDTVSGISANTYFLLNAQEEGKLIVSDALTTISLRLMQQDLAARIGFDGSADGLELPVNTIQAYHTAVFNAEAGVSADAWTPNIALNSLSTDEQREELWDNLLEASFIEPLSPVIDYLQILAAVGGSDDEYLRDLEVSGITAAAIVAADIADTPLDLGDTSSSIAIGNGGYIISGTATDDATLFGTSENDVLLGFDGNDILLGGEGNDRLYGGEGADFINGGEGDDIIGLEEPDGDADIIAVGQGYDWITGKGDAEDRIVIPSELLLPPGSIINDDEDEDNAVIISSGTGAATPSGIALLGGSGSTSNGSWQLPTFTDADGNRTSPNSVPQVAIFPDYSLTSTVPEQIIPADPDNPDGFEDTVINAQFFGFVTFFVDYYSFENIEQNRPDVLEHYNQLGYINNPNSLFIQIRYFTDNGRELGSHFVLIEDFANGDFGINLVNGTPSPEDIDGFANEGEYIEIPQTPELLEPDLETGSQPLNNPRIIGDRFANFLEGDERDNTISGRNGDDELIGNAGNDNLFAGNGNDILTGGTGADRLNGGSGADNINGGEGIDTAVYAQSDSGVSVDLELGTGLGGDASGDIILDVENLVGSSFDDSLTGNSEDNRLVGNSGNDALFGGAGNDRLIGGEGSDQLIGGQGTDTAVYTQSDAGVIINLAAGTGVNGDANGDILSEIENVVGSEFNDTLIGDNENNRLVGRNGNDTISGGGGNDRILGGEGDDLLTGGIGNDVFIYGQGFGSDIIFDFEAGIGNADRINLKALNINSFDDVLNSATEENGGVLLSLDEGSIFIEDLTIDQLHQNDFIL